MLRPPSEVGGSFVRENTEKSICGGGGTITPGTGKSASGGMY
jgi:hypothetical protein